MPTLPSRGTCCRLLLLTLLVLAPRALATGGGLATTYVKALNTGTDDSFGRAVALSGDTLVVGALLEDDSATGVGSPHGDDGAANSGAAYVFVRTPGGWTGPVYLKASNARAQGRFGESVAIHGDTLVVGAPGDSSAATGVDGNQADTSAPGAGAVYVFVRQGGVWTQQAYLKASNAQAEDRFGISVSISGDTIVVGARFEDGSAVGVDGDQGDNGAPDSGAAYVFVRQAGIWSQQAYLKASNTDAGDELGFAACASGDSVIVGAYREDSAAAGIDGDAEDDSLPDSGAAYVFVRNGSRWSQQAYLKAFNPDADDRFGDTVSMDADRVAVGAHREDSTATGLGGNPANDDAPNSGAAYVFVRNEGTWTQEAYLKASNAEEADQFGTAVAIAGARLLVGARLEDSAATNRGGSPLDDSAPGSGAAYLFARHEGAWLQQAYIKASNTGAGDEFGLALALSGETGAVGARFEDSGATGIDGDGADDSAADSGAAYVVDPPPLPGSAWTDLGHALAGVTGDPLLVGAGSLAPISVNLVTLSDAAPSALAGLFLSLGPVTPTPFKGGTLVPLPVLGAPIVLATGPTGVIAIPFVMPAGIPPGTAIWVQYAIQDAAAVQGVALSNALEGVTP